MIVPAEVLHYYCCWVDSPGYLGVPRVGRAMPVLGRGGWVNRLLLGVLDFDDGLGCFQAGFRARADFARRYAGSFFLLISLLFRDLNKKLLI